MKKKTVVFGSTGTLGKEIVSLGNFLTPAHNMVDISNFEQVKNYFETEKPKVAIHLAALVGARECEENKELAYKTNVIGTENISKACQEIGTKLTYMGTDAIFDGEKGNYSEEDIPNPINYYALTKLAAECFVKMLPNHLIIRAAFSPKDNFPYERAFVDQYTSRIFADQLAKNILFAIKRDLTGVFHIGREKRSLYDAAKEINPSVGKITIAETGLNLPRDLSLNITKWRRIKNGS